MSTRICEHCEINTAMDDDFICQECFDLMVWDMEAEDITVKTCDWCHIQPAIKGDVLCCDCSDVLCINSL